MNLTLCLTHACNLRCAYCYAGAKDARSMAWETARGAIDLGVDCACRQAVLGGGAPEFQLGFFGGEPLLEWELLQRASGYAAQLCERQGAMLKRTVTTNMTLLDEAKAGWLRAGGFHVGLSLDGHAAMHDALRRFADGRGSHASCAPALGFFRGADARAEVIVVVDPRNVAHLAEAVDWLIAQEVRSIALNPNFYIEWPEAALEAWREAYARIGERYAACYRRGVPLSINVFDGKIRTRVQGGYAACDRCGFGTTEVAVAPSGNLYACERLVGGDGDATYRIGTVASGFDAARRAAVAALRGNVVEECRACPVRERCMNWCGCINAATAGAPNRVAGIVCFHERLAIEAADRAGAALFAERNPAFLAEFYGMARV